MLAMVSLAFLSTYLNGSLPDVINLATLQVHHLIGEMDLGQAVQDCTLICTYDQLFELHCTAD